MAADNMSIKIGEDTSISKQVTFFLIFVLIGSWDWTRDLLVERLDCY